VILPTIPDCQGPEKVFKGAKRHADDQGQKYRGLKEIQPILSGTVWRELFFHLCPFRLKFLLNRCKSPENFCSGVKPSHWRNAAKILKKTLPRFSTYRANVDQLLIPFSVFRFPSKEQRLSKSS